jgi:hypothetical protein
MAINLKEIFISDSDSIKLEKVNYNFDQLLSAGGGPKGPAGAKGDAGLQGVTGQKGEIGYQGNQGPQGAKGSSGAELWVESTGTYNNTIVSKHDNVTYTDPPNLVIGFNTTDPEYSTSSQDASVLLNRTDFFGSNLRLQSSSVPGYYIDYTVEEVAGTKKFKTSASSIANTKFEWSASEFSFRDYNSSNILYSITPSQVEASLDSVFEGSVTFNSANLVYNFGTPAAGKVIAANDSTGTFEWKYPDELGGVAPIGTIIGMMYDQWNDSNNFLGTSTPVTATLPTTDSLLQVTAGRGVGDYAGWYICNGKTWTNSAGTFTYTVPDLNSFSYTIADNSDTSNSASQGEVTVSNNELNLLGGIDLSMDAQYSSPQYSISFTQNTADDIVYTGGSGTQYTIKRIPQIIFLGETDLFWTDNSGQVSPPHDVTYTFQDNGGVISDVSYTIGVSEGYSAGDPTSFSVSLPGVQDTQYYWSPASVTNISGWPVNTPNINQSVSSSAAHQMILNITNLTHPANTVTAVTITYDSTNYIYNPTVSYTINLVPANYNAGSPQHLANTEMEVEFGLAQTDAEGNTVTAGGTSHTFTYQANAAQDQEIAIVWNTNTSNQTYVINDAPSVQVQGNLTGPTPGYWIERGTVNPYFNSHSYTGSGSWYNSDGTGSNSFSAPNLTSNDCGATGYIRINAADMPTATTEEWLHIVTPAKTGTCTLPLNFTLDFDIPHSWASNTYSSNDQGSFALSDFTASANVLATSSSGGTTVPHRWYFDATVNGSNVGNSGTFYSFIQSLEFQVDPNGSYSLTLGNSGNPQFDSSYGGVWYLTMEAGNVSSGFYSGNTVELAVVPPTWTDSSPGGNTYTVTYSQDPSQPIFFTVEGCIVFGQPVKMADGSTKLVEDLVVGDVLQAIAIDGFGTDEEAWRTWTSDSFSQQAATVTVTEAVHRTSTNHYLITLANGKELKTTYEHGLLIDRSGTFKWIQTFDLVEQDKLFDAESGLWSEVQSIQHLTDQVNVVTLDVENQDNFMVNGIIVHNNIQK